MFNKLKSKKSNKWSSKKACLHDQIPISPEILAERLKTIQKCGYRLYQLMEYRQALNLTSEDIKRCADILTECGYSQISVPMIKFVNIEKQQKKILSQCVNEYIKENRGFISKSDYLLNKLDASHNEITSMVLRFPSLSHIGISKLESKMNFLLDNGAWKSDIVNNPRIFITHSLKKLKLLVKQAKEQGFSDRLPIHKFTQSFKTVEESLKKGESYSISHKQRDIVTDSEVRKLCSDLDVELSEVTSAKVHYLMKIIGYSAEEILSCPRIIGFSMDKLRKSYEDMVQAGYDKPRISMFNSYIRVDVMPLSENLMKQKLFKNLLGVKHVKSIPPALHPLLRSRLNEIHDVKENIAFLNSEGIDNNTISELPIILIHEPENLKLFWTRVIEEYKQDIDNSISKVQLLNLLQYEIEKSINFGYR